MSGGIGVGFGFVGVAFVVGWVLLWRVPRLGPAGSSGVGFVSGVGVLSEGAVVSVVVPARDEAAALPTLLESLRSQTRRADEIVVVDDHSEDATAACAAAGGALVVASAALPRGWTGKTWACAQGVQAAHGDVLVFLDADTRLAPDALARILAEHQRRGGVLTVQPYHRMRRPFERLSAWFNVVSMMGVGAASARPGAPVTGAFGPCLVSRRADYEAVGGHASVRGEVLEDAALGRRFQQAGIAVRAFGGRGVIEFRMYAGGLRSLVEGWSKNFASGAGTVPVARLAGIVAWIAACLRVGWDAARGLADLGTAIGPPSLVWIAYGAFAVQAAVMLHQLGSFSWYTPVLFPLVAAFFVAVFARSAWLTLVRGEVRWKGRAIPVR